MTLDPFTLAIMSALVVTVAGTLFIAETLLRREEGAGRIWALAYLCAVLTSVAYLAWAANPAMWWAIGVGNMAFVAATALMWLGCVRFNSNLRRLYVGAVVAAVLATFLTAVVQGPGGGWWAGSEVTFGAIALFAAAGAVETTRGALAQNLNARILGIVLAIQALYYLLRVIVFVGFGENSAIFNEVFGTQTTTYFTVALSMTTLMTTSVLRADKARLRAHSDSSTAGYTSDRVLVQSSFQRLLLDRTERAEIRLDPLVVIAIVVDDLQTIATAFGETVATEVAESWIEGVRRHTPASALIGEDGPGRLFVVTDTASVNEAKALAMSIYLGLLEDAGMAGAIVRPAVGIGLALSSMVGYHPESLLDGARAAAVRAAADLEASVVVAV